MRAQTPMMAFSENPDATQSPGVTQSPATSNARTLALQKSRLDAIAGLLEREVIPHMARAHRRRAAAVTADPAPNRHAFSEAEIAAFADTTLSTDETLAGAFVETHLAAGVPVEDIYLHLFAPTARRLGASWEDDSLDFTQVMAGLTRLHVLLHELSRRFDTGGRSAGRARRILVAPNPGEQHVFGPLMVAEFFRRAGWDSRCDLSISSAGVARLVREESLDAIGLSCASERYLAELERCIRAARRAARGRAFAILVGGVAFAARPELATMVGADGTANDGPSAVVKAESLVAPHRLAI